jgi:hypothetical protein
LLNSRVRLVAGNILIVVCNVAHVFHRAHSVVWAKGLIELIEGIRRVKHDFVKPDAFNCHSEPVVLQLCNMVD